MQLLTYAVILTLPYFVFSRPDLVSVIENACKPEKEYRELTKKENVRREISFRAEAAYEACVQSMRVLLYMQIEDRKNRPWRKNALPLEVVMNQNCLTHTTSVELFNCLRYAS
ncbi:hypothetical protein TcasGA2_TC015561 [Tribolium castaneum]|uniref:Uncharacterized protein n=1 Tax=Tribolium castaneum TaxID=7070 RepID=D2A5L4_TRICA|nr:PREDICTED: uncharacterized protein LOC107398069 [Tribolium castaneum]EFA05389.1 hypothetical protein TcasGA2_TC015561 [Tribolium castaneum]|eukprot:XP_015836388.1 PREDICTED: uncharacterized protein LOC107398069 [Tribolium castaneum]